MYSQQATPASGLDSMGRVYTAEYASSSSAEFRKCFCGTCPNQIHKTDPFKIRLCTRFAQVSWRDHDARFQYKVPRQDLFARPLTPVTFRKSQCRMPKLLTRSLHHIVWTPRRQRGSSTQDILTRHERTVKTSLNKFNKIKLQNRSLHKTSRTPVWDPCRRGEFASWKDLLKRSK